MIVYTIGHSRHPIDKFLQLLAGHGIVQLLDVRSSPYSRFNPQFNKASLQLSLLNHNIQYIYAGTELGGRPRDPSCYKLGATPGKEKDYLKEVDYQVVMKRAWFITGIQQLLDLAKHDTTSIMCSEEDPSYCHRHHLIAAYLIRQYPDVTIFHIRKDGNLLNAKSIQSLPNKPNEKPLSI